MWSETCRSDGTDMCIERVNELETSDTEAIDESYHFRGIGNQIVSSFMKLRVPGSIDGKR